MYFSVNPSNFGRCFVHIAYPHYHINPHSFHPHFTTKNVQFQPYKAENREQKDRFSEKAQKNRHSDQTAPGFFDNFVQNAEKLTPYGRRKRSFP